MYDDKFPSIYRGVVENNIDPEGLGRCKVRVPALHGELNYPLEMLPWARPIVLSPVKNKRGTVNLPDKGDIVWVLFEGSDREFPVYLGGTYGKGEIGVGNNNVTFYIENDNSISFTRDSSTYDIKIGERHIIIDPKGITIKGDVLIEGNVHVTKKLVADIDVYGNGTSLHTHTHGGVDRGGSNTNAPN